MSTQLRLAGALALLCASACANRLAPAFDARFPDEDRARIEHVRARLSADTRPAAPSAGSLLAATTHGVAPELLVYDLERRAVRWRMPFRADSRPELLGDLALSSAGARLFAFDAQTGAARFSTALGDCAYTGAARDAARVFVACQYPARLGSEAAARLLALDARDGRVLWERRATGALGRPAAAAELVFVPWRRQSLAVLDARSGVELARVRTRDDVIEWVLADAGAVLFGQQSLHVLAAAHASGAGPGVTPIDTKALPGSPQLRPSGFEPQPGTRSARGRVALYFEPEVTGSDGVRAAHDRFYAVFYRNVFAYDATGALRWARMLPHDVLEGRALPSGLAVVTERGEVLLLPAEDGEPLPQADLGVALASAQLVVADLKPSAPRPAPPPLRRSLTEIALDTDNRLVPARAYAVARLAEQSEPEVTRDLLDVYSASATPPELKRVVADALRARRTGLEHLVDALLARYDFLEQTRPAPLSVIVPALVEARETRALPHLVARMFDHETPLAVLPAVVSAVATLGGPGAIEPLLAFLRLYRADSSFAAEPDALVAAARGVLAHGGDAAAAQLSQLLADGRASAALAGELAALLAPQPAVAGASAVAAAAPPASPALPERLDDDAVRATFAEHADDLRACIIDELGRNPKLAQVRLAFIAESDGSTHAWSFVPNTPEFVDCLYAKASDYRFPRFRAARELVRYVVSVRASEPAPPPARDATGQPWWHASATRPRTSDTAELAAPWWQSHQPLAPLSLTTQRPTAPPSQNPPSPTLSPPPSPTLSPPPTPSPSPTEDAWWTPAQAPP